MKHTTTNPKKVKQVLQEQVEFAIVLDNLELAIAQLYKMPLTDRQKALVKEVKESRL